jgi:hypothetical protein
VLQKLFDKTVPSLHVLMTVAEVQSIASVPHDTQVVIAAVGVGLMYPGKHAEAIVAAN